MSDLVVLALKLLFLALLWLFVLFVGNVIRTDMFGRKLATNEVELRLTAAELKKQQKRRSQDRPQAAHQPAGVQGQAGGPAIPARRGLHHRPGRRLPAPTRRRLRLHPARAQVVRTETGFAVEDLGSTSGTYVSSEADHRLGALHHRRHLAHIGRTLVVLEK
ncbi:MAG: hypothetical protein R2719_04255 [Micropruina sp.]